MLLHIPNLLAPDETTHCHEALRDAGWTDGRATVGAQGAQVKRNRQLPEDSPVAATLGAHILGALSKSPLFMSAALPLRIAPPLFNRYEGGEHYGLHIDGAMRAVPGSATPMRTDVSCTLFLSAPEDYDGGELVIVDTYGTHEVKLPAGDLVVYPATSLHRVEPVTRGARVASFFWAQSMVADAGQRAMLFELDQNIQKLRQRVGDCEEVVALTGHYHNLVRQWSRV